MVDNTTPLGPSPPPNNTTDSAPATGQDAPPAPPAVEPVAVSGASQGGQQTPQAETAAAVVEPAAAEATPVAAEAAPAAVDTMQQMKVSQLLFLCTAVAPRPCRLQPRVQFSKLVL